MKSKANIGMIVLVISIFLFGGIAFAEGFSADMVFTTEDGVFRGKIFVTEEKERMEIHHYHHNKDGQKCSLDTYA